MNNIRALAITLFMVFVVVDSAFANPAFGSLASVCNLLIPFLVLIFLSLGGMYLMMEERKRYRRLITIFLEVYVGTVLLVFAIWIQFDFYWLIEVGTLIIAVFPIIGVLVGIFMIYLGIRSLFPNRPAYLARTRPWRMLISGIVLIAVILFSIFGTAFLFMKEAKETEKRNEAKAILNEIYNAEMGYFAANNTFSKDRVSIGLETDAVKTKYYRYEIISADEKGFLARAWGSIDKDSDLDIWEQTEADEWPYRVFDDTEDEGVHIDPHDPKRHTPKRK